MSKEQKIAESVAEYFDAQSDEEFIENLKKDLNRFGTDKKRSGARSMAKIVRDMRTKQKGYFKADHGTPIKKQYLEESKKLEAQVDRAVEAVLK